MNTTTAIAEHDAELVPDEARWGQGYGGRAYSPAELDTIASNVAPARGPGHPARLHAGDPGFDWVSDTAAHVPSGYDILNHPNRANTDPARLDPAAPTSVDGQPQVSKDLQAYFRRRGWALDQHGRPLHPHARQLLADPRIGLPTSLGFAYHLGESVVADVVAVAADQVVLTTRATRHEGLIPALPGGYGIPADQGATVEQWRGGARPVTAEGIITTARRKLTEETGLVAPPDSHVEIVRAIRPVSSVHTLHAWTVVFTVRIDLPARANLTLRPDAGADWWPVAMLQSMWPDHRRALVAALG
ncbi:NUDIX domain-containing protein [Actinokineospora enzanensis]|uniref:NUDIX domain-containing protein n=1 Tax=Actinokineospora enzanensis TaxID=155975 RepID=UPI00036C5DA8|nr:NUDIX hydrolase [Actinokineospora enzanensis]